MPAMQQQKFPFRYHTRQRIQPIGQQTFVPNSRVSFELPRVGFLAGIFLRFNGFIDRAGGSIPALYAPTLFNLLNRIQVNINIGSAAIFDCTGYGTALLNNVLERGFYPAWNGTFPVGLSGGSATGTLYEPDVYNADPTVPATTRPLNLSYFIPIAANDGRNFNMGLINLQAPEVRCTLDIQTGNIADLFTPGDTVTTTTFSASPVPKLQASYLFYEVPDPSRVFYPPLILHRCLEERQAINSTGDQVYTVPKQGTLLRQIHSVILDNVPSTASVDGLRIRFNRTDTVYDEQRYVNRWLAVKRYGHDIPAGMFVHDFWHSEDMVGHGDTRDTIDTEAISTLESIVTLNSAAALGAGNNFMDSIREIVQILQV